MNTKQKHVLVLVNTQLWELFHAESIEICLRHVSNGDKVVVAYCDGALAACAPNAKHIPEVCIKCRHISDHMRFLLAKHGIDFTALNLESSYPYVKDLDFTFESNDDLARITYNEMPIGLLAASQIIDNCNDVYFSIKDQASLAQNLIKSGIMLYEWVCSYAKEKSITDIYVWNGRRPCDGPAIYAAQSLNLNAYSYICGSRPESINISLSAAGQYPKAINHNKQLHCSRAIEEIGKKEVMKRGLRYYRAYSMGKTSGVGSREAIKRYCRLKRFSATDYPMLNLKKPILLVLTSSPSESYFMTEYYAAFGSDPHGHYMSIFSNALILDKYNVIVRWHPAHLDAGSNERKRINQCMVDYKEYCHIPPDSAVDTYTMLDYCDVVATQGSTLGWYASIRGIPVIVYGPFSLLAGNSVYGFNSKCELLELLAQDSIPSLPYQDALLLGHYLMNHGENMNYVNPSHITDDFAYNWHISSNGNKMPIHPVFDQAA